MAEERARMLGRKRALPTALEVAAAQWEKEREARTGEGQEETATLPRPSPEGHPFSLQTVPLQTRGVGADQEADWWAYALARNSSERSTGAPTVRGVSALSRRLIAIERARVLRSKPADAPGVVKLQRKAQRRGEQG
jgi:hypothetical protein